jgi:hypothetical protein
MLALLCAGAVTAAFVFDDSLKDVWAQLWDEPAQSAEGQPTEPEAPPLQANADAKGDRLAAPPPKIEEPASLALATAQQTLLTPPMDRWIGKPPPPRPTTVLLDDKQIASIKQRLRLTAAQEKYWPPVERALKDLVLMLHEQRRRPVETLDPENETVKRLLAAAGPFLKQLRPDQKNEIQSLARMAGLSGAIASVN